MLYVAGFCLLGLIAIALVGDRSALLFGGDEAQARRVVVPVMMLMAGGAFGFAMPALFGWLSRTAQQTIAAGGSDSGLAIWVQSPGFTGMMSVLGWVAMIAILIVFSIFAWLFATGRITGA